MCIGFGDTIYLWCGNINSWNIHIIHFVIESEPVIIHRVIHSWFVSTMPVRVTCPPMDVVPPPPPPAKSKQQGVSRSLLYNGSKFKGHQKSKGNQYDVEVILQVINEWLKIISGLLPLLTFISIYLIRILILLINIQRFFLILQHVDLENSYLCGYLKIKGLTEEYPTLTTFFDGEIISKKHPFLTRKWDADEDVDKKHWVSLKCSNPFVLVEVWNG